MIELGYDHKNQINVTPTSASGEMGFIKNGLSFNVEFEADIITAGAGENLTLCEATFKNHTVTRCVSNDDAETPSTYTLTETDITDVNSHFYSEIEIFLEYLEEDSE